NLPLSHALAKREEGCKNNRLKERERPSAQVIRPCFSDLSDFTFISVALHSSQHFIENSNSLSKSPTCCSVFVVAAIRLVSPVKVVVQSGIR
ncbi:hypothetical protein M5D96_007062, partial [Drosophila gunungcola]